AAGSVLVPAGVSRSPPRAQRAAIAPAKSSGKQLQRRARRIKPARAAATSGDEFFPRDYFFIQAIIAAMIPIALKSDIIPAGMILPVRRNLGMNCPARRREMMNAVVSPTARCSERRNAPTSSNTPVIEPAMIDATLPALT